eukprot:1158508-Pelagomonas_calceolata.AAC.21
MPHREGHKPRVQGPPCVTKKACMRAGHAFLCGPTHGEPHTHGCHTWAGSFLLNTVEARPQHRYQMQVFLHSGDVPRLATNMRGAKTWGIPAMSNMVGA